MGPISIGYKLKTKSLKISHLVGLSPTPLDETQILLPGWLLSIQDQDILHLGDVL